MLGRFGPYFTDRYRTPWGDALNFDGAGSDEVRRYFIDSAVAFVVDHHVDGFRLDALHAIVDPTSYTFVEQLADEVGDAAGTVGRDVVLIAESSANEPRLVRLPAEGRPGARRSVERRPPPRPAGGAHRRAPRLLRGLQRAPRCRQGARAPLRVHRAALAVPGPPARPARRRRGAPVARGLLREPRPRRQPSRRRPPRPPRRLRAAQARPRRRAPVAVHAAAVHGRGVRRAASVPLLRRPHRPCARRGGPDGPAGRVRRRGVVRRRPRPRRPRHVRRPPSSTRPSAPRATTPCCGASTARSSGCAGS